MFIIHAIIKNSADATSAIKAAATRLEPVLIPSASLLAVVSRVADHDAGTLFEDADRVREIGLLHNELLVKLVAQIDLVPVRLGALHSDEAAVLNQVEENAAFFEAALAHISGAVEVTLDVVNKAVAELPAVATTPATGRDYLKARHAQKNIVRLAVSSRETFINELAQEVSQICRDQKPEGSQRLCVLVERAKLDDFIALFDTLQQRAVSNHLELTASGPWPAYSFVGAAA